MSRRRPLRDAAQYVQKKIKEMGNLWPYIQRVGARFSLTMDWWWMAIGPSLSISARERETKFSTPVIHTHTHTKEDKVFFPSFLKVDINRLVKVSLSPLIQSNGRPRWWGLSFYFYFHIFSFFLPFSRFGMRDIGTRADSLFEKRDNDTEKKKKEKLEGGWGGGG